jgi:hypothetical protein
MSDSHASLSESLARRSSTRIGGSTDFAFHSVLAPDDARTVPNPIPSSGGLIPRRGPNPPQPDYFSHHQIRVAPNEIELHPILVFRCLSP